MTPRHGLCVAVVGLIITVVCGLLTYLLPQFGFVLWGFAGFVVMMVGLVMAGVATLVKKKWLTPRQGLGMTLVGFVIIVSCAIPAYVIPETARGEPGGLRITRLFVLGLVREHNGHHPGVVEVLREWGF